MRFGVAIDHLMKHGGFIARECHGGREKIGFRLPDGRSDLGGAYFYQSLKVTEHDELTVPWAPGNFDMTAHDWRVINEQ